MKNAIIFGGSGFIGGFFAQHLIENCFYKKVYILDIESPMDKESSFRRNQFLELKDKISDVIISSRLTKSPVLLVAEESGMDINMEKLMKMHNQKTPDSKKILEINAKHPMIVKISQNLSNFDHKKISQIILDQANILDGNVLSNPSNYMESLTELFIK